MTPRQAFLLVRRHVARHRLRTTLTVLGMAFAVTLLVVVHAFANGLDRALSSGEKNRTLIVYRENRYCPQTSLLPERYADVIRAMDGVEAVLPVRVYLNNCRANLDLVTFHGVPVDHVHDVRPYEIVERSSVGFESEPDAALIGQDFAHARGLRPGDAFRFGGIDVKVAGIFAARDRVLDGVILTHLEFLQRAGPVARLGTVTQFEVLVRRGQDPARVAHAIDTTFETSEEPTSTRTLGSFLQRSTRDLQEFLRFARGFALACFALMIVLLGNTLFLSVQDRRRTFGALATIGFRARWLVGMVLLEAFCLAVVGCLLGALLVLIVAQSSGLAIGVEGVRIEFAWTFGTYGSAFLLTLVAAALAAALPAWHLARLDPVRALRETF